MPKRDEKIGSSKERMIYRKAVWTDAMEITDLWDAMHREIDTLPSIRKEHENKKSLFLNIVTRIELPDWIIQVIEEEGKLVGFVMGRVQLPNYSDCHYLGFCEALYVLPEHRHTGIYKELLEAAMKVGREKKAEYFDFVGPYDMKLVSFWAKMDFEPIYIIYRRAEGKHERIGI